MDNSKEQKKIDQENKNKLEIANTKKQQNDDWFQKMQGIMNKKEDQEDSDYNTSQSYEEEPHIQQIQNNQQKLNHSNHNKSRIKEEDLEESYIESQMSNTYRKHSDSEISFLNQSVIDQKLQTKYRLQRLMQTFKEEANHVLSEGEEEDQDDEISAAIVYALPVFNDIQNEQIEEDLNIEFQELYEEEQKEVQPKKYLDIIEMTEFEKIETYKDDKVPLFKVRKFIWLTKATISFIAYKIIKSIYFELATLLVILTNSVVLALDEPGTEQSQTLITMDTVFLVLYTIEMVLKIIGLGFIFNKNSYMRDPWNVLDFIIVVADYPSVIFENQEGVDLSALRSLRVLRPLRTISSIKALRNILAALFSAFKPLMNSILMLLFFFMVFAIGSLQLFMGVLKNRCFYPDTGIIYQDLVDEEPYCASSDDCFQWDENLICGKMNDNPNWNLTNFDTIGWSFLQVFQVVTLEGWTEIMYAIMRTYSIYMALFFIVIVFIGAFFLMNLTLAIIKVKFSSAQNESQEVTQEDKDAEAMYKDQLECFELDKLRDAGIYKSNKYKEFPVDPKQMQSEELLNLNSPNKFESNMDIRQASGFQGKITMFTKLKYNESESEKENNNNNSNTRNIQFAENPTQNIPNFSSVRRKSSLKQQEGQTYTPNSNKNQDEGVIELLKNARRKSIMISSPQLRFQQDKARFTPGFVAMGMSKFKQGLNRSRQPKKSTILTQEQLQKVRDSIRGKKGYKIPKLKLQQQKNAKIVAKSSENHQKVVLAGSIIKNFQSKKFNHTNSSQQDHQNTQQDKSKRGSVASYGRGLMFNSQASNIQDSNPSHHQQSQVMQINDEVKSDRELDEIDINQIPNEHTNTKQGQGSQQEKPNFDHLLNVDVNIMGLRKNQTPKSSNQNSQQTSHQNLKSPISMDALNPSALSAQEQQQVPRFTEISKIPQQQKPPRDQSNKRNKSNPRNHETSRSRNRNNSQKSLMTAQQLTQSNQSHSKQSNSNSNVENYKVNREYRKKTGNYNSSSQQRSSKNRSRRSKGSRITPLQARQGTQGSLVLTPTASYVMNSQFSQSNYDDEEDDSCESFDINNPQNKIYMEDDEDFTGELKFDHKFHQDLGIMRDIQKKIDKKRQQTIVQHRRKKTSTIQKKSQNNLQTMQLQKKATMIGEDPEDLEIDRLRSILDSRYLKCRILYNEDYHENEQIDDVLPSKKILLNQQLEKEKMELRQQLHFKLIYDFENPRMNEQFTEHKNDLSQRNKSFLNSHRKSQVVRKTKRASSIAKFLQGKKNEFYMSYNFKDELIQQKLKYQDRLLATVSQYNDLKIEKIEDKKAAKQEAAIQFNEKVVFDKYFLVEDEDEMEDIDEKSLFQNINNQEEKKEVEPIVKHEEDNEEDNEENEEAIKKKNQELEHDYNDHIEEQFNQRPNYYGYCPYNVNWSGEDVLGMMPTVLLKKTDTLKKLGKVIKALNYGPFDYNMWEGGIIGIINAMRRIVLKFVMSSYFDMFIMICVFLNTLILAMEGLVEGEGADLLDQFNLVFTIIFTVDMGLKLIGMGPIEYVRDPMNCFDGVIVIISLVELALTSGKKSAFSAFRSVRIFRAFRVLRVTKLIRSLQYMKIIIEVISQTIQSFFYIFLLLILFNYIYALLGMQMFGAKFTFDDAPRMNFDTFFQAFMTVFQVMTMENWTDILFACLRTDNNMGLTLIFLVSWIFIGNYVLLNLFLSILLDAFDNQASENADDLKFDIAEDIQLDQGDLNQTQSVSLYSSKMQQSSLNNNTLGFQSPPQQNTLNSPQNQSVQKYQYPQNNNISSFKNQNNSDTNKTNGFNFLQSNAVSTSKLPTFTAFPVNTLSPQNQTLDKNQEPTQLEEDELREDFDEDDDEDKKDKSVKHKKKKMIMFENIFCEKSFYVFSKSNPIRRWMYRIVKHGYFEWTILVAIIVSSLKLVLDTYIDSKDPSHKQIYDIGTYVDSAFTVFFALEAIFKIISFGFVLEDNSYLRESWNKLDFFIVLASLVDFALQQDNNVDLDLGFVKILRLLRILRPLRFISHNKNMKIVVTALLESAPAVINVFIVVLLIWMMFGILGINLMRNKLYYCDFPSGYDDSGDLLYKVGKFECERLEGAEWKVYDMNFDNIFSSMMTLFVLSTVEGWPDYLWQFVDGENYDENPFSENYGVQVRPPKKDNYPLMMLYFVIFLFVGSMFLLNLFIGVVQLNFMLAESAAKNKYLSDDQTKWIEIQRLIIKSQPDYHAIKPPDNQFQKYIWYFCESWVLESFIMVCVILNVVLMAISYETQTAEYEDVLSDINLVFTIIFIVEMVLKLIAYGIKGYFMNSWNRFDFFVVMTSLLDIYLTLIGNKVKFLQVGPQLGRVFRVLRVTRLFKLVKKLEELQKLIQVTILTLPQLMNIAALLFLVFFIFSILGCFLFSHIQDGDVLNDYVNFTTFDKAFILLFQCSTGEDWHKAMFDTMHHNSFSSIYFIIFVVLIQFIMINLFILIILIQFEENYINSGDDNPLTAFKTNEQAFKAVWVKYTRQQNGIKLDSNKLIDFYLEVKSPLGLDWKEKEKKYEQQVKSHRKVEDSEMESLILQERTRLYKIAAQILMHMEVRTDHSGYIYFNDMMFFLYRTHLREKVEARVPKKKNEPIEETEANFQEAKIILDKEEKQTLYKCERIKRKQNKSYRQKGKKFPTANPMVRQMFVNMCYKAWLNHSIQYYEKKLHEKNNGEDEVPEILTSTDSQTDSNDEYNIDDIDEDIEKTSEQRQIEKENKKNKIIYRTHQKQQFIEERYPNLKFKSINQINTDIYKQEFENDENSANNMNPYTDITYNDPNLTIKSETDNNNLTPLNLHNQSKRHSQYRFSSYTGTHLQQQYLNQNTLSPANSHRNPQKRPSKSSFTSQLEKHQNQSKRLSQKSQTSLYTQQQSQPNLLNSNQVNNNGSNNQINNNQPGKIHRRAHQSSISIHNISNIERRESIQNQLQSQFENVKDKDSLKQEQIPIINYNIQNNIIINNNYYYQDENQDVNNPANTPANKIPIKINSSNNINNNSQYKPISPALSQQSQTSQVQQILMENSNLTQQSQIQQITSNSNIPLKNSANNINITIKPSQDDVGSQNNQQDEEQEEFEQQEEIVNNGYQQDKVSDQNEIKTEQNPISPQSQGSNKNFNLQK